MNRSEIQKARLEEQEFQKAYEELFGDTFEKAKHKDGDMHPNGKWVWVSSANGGKGDWRTANGRAHKKSLAGNAAGGGNSSAGKTGGGEKKAAEKSSTDKPVKTDKPKAKTKAADKPVKTDKSKNESKTTSSNQNVKLKEVDAAIAVYNEDMAKGIAKFDELFERIDKNNFADELFENKNNVIVCAREAWDDGYQDPQMWVLEPTSDKTFKLWNYYPESSDYWTVDNPSIHKNFANSASAIVPKDTIKWSVPKSVIMKQLENSAKKQPKNFNFGRRRYDDE